MTVKTSELKFKWHGAVTLALAVLVFILGYALWQARQEIATLRPHEAPLSPVEERILAELEREESSLFTDPWSGSLFGSDPFIRLQQMQRRMDTLFGSPGNPANGIGFGGALPEITLEESQDEFRLLVKVPEEHEIDLNTQVEEREVTVSGNISARVDRGDNGVTSHFNSRSQFARTFQLPAAVDALAARTEQSEDGLAVVLPKKLS